MVKTNLSYIDICLATAATKTVINTDINNNINNNNHYYYIIIVVVAIE